MCGPRLPASVVRARRLALGHGRRGEEGADPREMGALTLFVADDAAAGGADFGGDARGGGLLRHGVWVRGVGVVRGKEKRKTCPRRDVI